MSVPVITGEARLRLLSMQHNLLTKLEGISGAGLSRLVFLDVYGNQLERITGLESLNNLRVLLLGKNRQVVTYLFIFLLLFYQQLLKNIILSYLSHISFII